jgi:molybdopterin converting factor small subunit
MRISIKLFAMARDICGRETVDLVVNEHARIGDVRNVLIRQIPAFSTLLRSSCFAVNAQFVDDEFPLREGDEVACIPPVSGG